MCFFCWHPPLVVPLGLTVDGYQGKGEREQKEKRRGFFGRMET
jgi:hypothetical protein